MNATDLRRLGTTAVEVTALGFGCGPLGNLMAPISDREALATVEAGISGGIAYFDTSPFYGAGLSERRLGLALGDARRRVTLSTKVGRLLRPGGTSDRRVGAFVDCPPLTPVFDYSRDATLRSIDDSLQRLGTDVLDVVLIHDVSPRMHGEQLEDRVREALAGALPALVELRDAGVIGAIGLGVSDWRVCLRFAREAKLDVFLLACAYTLLDQEPLLEFLPFCAEQRISVIAAAPFVSGILAGGVGRRTFFYEDAPSQVIARVERIEAICRAHGVALPAAALQMPAAHPAVACVLPGCRSPREVSENIVHFNAAIPGPFWEDLRREGLIAPETPVP